MHQRWLAGDPLLKLNAAKRYAVEMVKGIRPGKIVTDPIADLNRMQLEPVSHPAPLDIMGGRNIWHDALRCDCARSIIETECPMLIDTRPGASSAFLWLWSP
jgi:hypothetical protein